MSFIQMFFLGVGLSMDAAAVSMTNGLEDNKMKVNKALIIALFFGVFQGVMPLLGYFIADSIISGFVIKFAPWIALILLGLIGSKMLIDGIKNKDEDEDVLKQISIKRLLIQAFATSIDALSVGLVFVSYGTKTAILASSVIASTTFLISFASVYIGKKFGTMLSNKAEILGGIILIIIGLSIFIKSFI